MDSVLKLFPVKCCGLKWFSSMCCQLSLQFSYSKVPFVPLFHHSFDNATVLKLQNPGYGSKWGFSVVMVHMASFEDEEFGQLPQPPPKCIKRSFYRMGPLSGWVNTFEKELGRLYLTLYSPEPLR
jgi:hypothetical protein